MSERPNAHGHITTKITSTSHNPARPSLKIGRWIEAECLFLNPGEAAPGGGL
jgi:hypothetical protein